MQSWRRLTDWLGAWSLLAVTWGLALLLSLWAIADLAVLHVSTGLASSTYDAMVRARVHAPPRDPRLVIVDIDEASLQAMAKEFGRWPWPRDTLATVLSHIEKQQPAAIAWDILFSDADRLSPGGDKAFDDAAKRSTRSHFAVVRLPAEYDAHSQLTRTALPGLWLDTPPATAQTATVALIAPVLPAVAAARLGYNNGYTDADGVLRRYRYVQSLPDGSHLQSLAVAVARTVAPDLVAASAYPAGAAGLFSSGKDALMVWRKEPNSYPRISFADVFIQAEGGTSTRAVPSFTGKVVLIGSTASSLHDVHPTPLSAQQAGVDSLATAMDNAINGRHLAELPAWLQAAMAVLLVLGMATWVLKNGVSSLDPALLLLPAALLAVSYASLNIGHLFLDLHLAAGVALLFMALLKLWNGWRRNHWCGDSPAPQCLLALRTHSSVADAALDQLIRWLELHAPQARLLSGDATATWPARLRWPEMGMQVCIQGPREQLEGLHALPHSMIAQRSAVTAITSAERSAVAAQALALQYQLQNQRHHTSGETA